MLLQISPISGTRRREYQRAGCMTARACRHEGSHLERGAGVQRNNAPFPTSAATRTPDRGATRPIASWPWRWTEVRISDAHDEVGETTVQGLSRAFSAHQEFDNWIRRLRKSDRFRRRRFSTASIAWGSPNWHSQIVSTYQPSSKSSAVFLTSRCLLESSFAFQKSCLVFGIPESWQP
jgi:hypothetical protein